MNPFTIIVPYRDRAGHLVHFIRHMRQRFRDPVEILVVEQSPGKGFNRGKLLNIGFLEANPQSLYFAMHDVDMLPVKADYSFPATPTHLATKVSQFRFKMPFPEYFGGVTLFNEGDFRKCNGYSNNFWTWGAEDNEMHDNVLKSGLTITRRSCTFESLHHRPEDRSQHADNCAKWRNIQLNGRDPDDGMCRCKYSVLKTHNFTHYKMITVEI